MRGLRGLLTGALALIALETLTRNNASKRVSGLFTLPGAWAKRFLDPTVPAIPDRDRAERSGSGPSGLRTGLSGRQAASTSGGSAATRYPSPFSRPAGLSATGGD
jgi:hypothetical protein